LLVGEKEGNVETPLTGCELLRGGGVQILRLAVPAQDDTVLAALARDNNFDRL